MRKAAAVIRPKFNSSEPLLCEQQPPLPCRAQPIDTVAVTDRDPVAAAQKVTAADFAVHDLGAHNCVSSCATFDRRGQRWGKLFLRSHHGRLSNIRMRINLISVKNNSQQIFTIDLLLGRTPGSRAKKALRSGRAFGEPECDQRWAKGTTLRSAAPV